MEKTQMTEQERKELYEALCSRLDNIDAKLDKIDELIETARESL